MDNLIVTVNDTRRQRQELENLLMRRDLLRKEANSFEIAFTRELGEKLREILELKIDCIKKKKTLSYCAQYRNAGRIVNAEAVKNQVELEMKAYYYELEEMVKMNAVAKDATTAGDVDYENSKRIYRRLARLIHPDLNPATRDNDILMELWDRILEAYHSSDCEELENLEILVRREIEGAESSIELTDIGERIIRLEREIGIITETEPYTYIKILKDDDSIEQKKKELDNEYAEYETYSKELMAEIDKLMNEGGVRLIWKQ